MKRKKLMKAAVFFVMIMLGYSPEVYGRESAAVHHPCEAENVDIEIREYQYINGKEELWKDHPTVLPGDKISKIPRVHNDGTDCYIRVKIRFVNSNVIGEDHLFGISDSWAKAEDGYYYYKKVLKAGESTDIFYGLEIPGDLPAEMSGASFSIDIVVDAIQSCQFQPDFEAGHPWGDAQIQDSEKNDSQGTCEEIQIDPAQTSDSSKTGIYTVMLLISSGLLAAGKIIRKENWFGGKS